MKNKDKKDKNNIYINGINRELSLAFYVHIILLPNNDHPKRLFNIKFSWANNYCKTADRTWKLLFFRGERRRPIGLPRTRSTFAEGFFQPAAHPPLRRGDPFDKFQSSIPSYNRFRDEICMFAYLWNNRNSNFQNSFHYLIKIKFQFGPSHRLDD